MGFYYIITKKGIKHASADVGFCLLPTTAQADEYHLQKYTHKVPAGTCPFIFKKIDITKAFFLQNDALTSEKGLPGAFLFKL